MIETPLFLQRYGEAMAVGLAVLAALLLPLNLLTSQPLHHDEALYATWALTIIADDPWLSQTSIDKPPLFLWLVAGTFRLLGATETTARTPSLVATLAIILLTYGLGRKLYDTATGILAAWLVALSPFTLLFASTALTDPTLIALVLAGCLAAAHGRSVWAGIFAALAIATKQQGLFFIPLIAGFLIITKWQESRGTSRKVAGHRVADDKVAKIDQQPQTSTSHVPRPTSHVLRPTFTLLLSLILTLLPFIIWDLTRSQPSAFFQQSLNNYGGLAFDITGFTQRWLGFLELLWYGTSSTLLNFIFILGLPFLLIYDLALTHKTHQLPNYPTTQSPKHPISQSPNLLISLFITIFLLIHTILSFQIWDRYLLGLIPLLALLLAQILLLPWAILHCIWPRAVSQQPWLPIIFGIGLAILLTATLSRPVQDAVHARYPLGSNSRGVVGIEQIVAYLQGNVGANTTLYHQWLGTHWRFHLWDYPYDLQFWDSPEKLIAKAEPGHLIAFPAWRSDTEARLALFEAGLGLRELVRAYKLDGSVSVVLYRIEQNLTTEDTE